jgi:hypothetical protein
MEKPKSVMDVLPSFMELVSKNTTQKGPQIVVHIQQQIANTLAELILSDEDKKSIQLGSPHCKNPTRTYIRILSTILFTRNEPTTHINDDAKCVFTALIEIIIAVLTARKTLLTPELTLEENLHTLNQVYVNIVLDLKDKSYKNFGPLFELIFTLLPDLATVPTAETTIYKKILDLDGTMVNFLIDFLTLLRQDTLNPRFQNDFKNYLSDNCDSVKRMFDLSDWKNLAIDIVRKVFPLHTTRETVYAALPLIRDAFTGAAKNTAGRVAGNVVTAAGRFVTTVRNSISVPSQFSSVASKLIPSNGGRTKRRQRVRKSRRLTK